MSENTIAVQSCVDRINRGDSEAKAELIQVAYERLQRMTRKMKRDFDRVGSKLTTSFRMLPCVCVLL